MTQAPDTDEPGPRDWRRLDVRPDRRPGVGMRLLSTAVPGVRRVRAQDDRYYEDWRAHNEDAVTRTGRRWVVLGDSMSQGVGASAHDGGWVGLLARRLRGEGHDLAVVNLSATGARVPDVLERQLPAWDLLPPGPPDASPPLVSVLIGSNDLVGGRAARDALPGAMARLVEQLPHGAVVATLPQPARAARLANRPLVTAAEQGRLRVVDMRESGPTSWRGRLAEDFFHPNDAGYAALADALEPAVRAALGDATS